ncbi:MAG: RNA polymerase sigma factor [Beijerinckiaceae bacterium]
MKTLKSKRPLESDGTDEHLVARVRGGDGPAFAAIMQRHNQRLYRIARGIVRDDAEAEDVVQETYVRAYSALSGFRGESSLATWLTRIALNEAFARVKRRRPSEELEFLDRGPSAGKAEIVFFPGVQAAANPEAAAARAEIRNLLERAVNDLPDTFRLVFLMRDVEEMSTEETAEHLGIRPETVKTRLHRARRLLRKSLDENLAMALRDTFPFLGARCGRVTAAVMSRLGLTMPA